MIGIEQQQRLLLGISRRLKRKITAYAIGGTAMMLLGLKEATLDIDLVFESSKDRDAFREAAKSLGYLEMDAVRVYGKRKNRPIMLKLADERLDLFVGRVIHFRFSEGMRRRAVNVYQFGDSLVLKAADPHDIIMLKCATDRVKDKDDARSIIEAVNINWDVLIDEAKSQIGLGEEAAAFELGAFLEELRNRMKANIPKQALDRLFSIVQGQAKEKQMGF
ncbi:MAG TPA: hypothetical protein ENN46_00675 [Candidatus Woesearchaeota archaeon]|nr:hypothetical protein [Candidatus Woesearchaeota archaeon]